jgi:hypothetical protein
MTRKTHFLIFVFALLLTPGLATAQGNLVLNGGFDADASGWTTASEFGFGYVSTKGDPGGYFFLYTNSSAFTPTISQTVSGLILGSSYTVSGNYEYIAGSSASPSFGVALDGVYLFKTAAPTDSEWHSFSFGYAAKSTSAVLSLHSQLNGTGVSYGIDNIAMYAVPEPAVLKLFGLFALFHCRRRRRPNLLPAANPATALVMKSWPQARGVAAAERSAAWKMRMRFISLVLFAAPLLSGCATDLRGTSQICQVHHKTMRTVFMRGEGITIMAGGRYEPAHREMFPNGHPSHLPKKMVIIYLCDDCLKAQREWFETHK